MSGSEKPDPNGEVRVGVPTGFTLERMTPLWDQMVARVEAQLGGKAVFVRFQKAADGDSEIVFRKA